MRVVDCRICIYMQNAQGWCCCVLRVCVQIGIGTLLLCFVYMWIYSRTVLMCAVSIQHRDVRKAGLCVLKFRAFLIECRALLIERRALGMGCKSLLMECKALVIECRALLVECRASLIECGYTHGLC